MTEQIRRIAVWSGRLRVAHWALAGATLVLLATGWLIEHAPSLAESAVEIHYLGASLLIFALVLRLYLGVFGQGAERLEHLLPRPAESAAMRASLWFYLSLGRAAAPNWFAHNPLWKPLYLVVFVSLLLAILTGWLMPENPLVGGLYLPEVHRWLAHLIGLLTVAHLFSVILQDVKGRSGDISGMFSGYRLFYVPPATAVKPDIAKVTVSLDTLAKPRRSDKQR
ncbi:MAG: cytochrome b/b6 domain-containing protein [Sedimenticolaceae bacterium]